jgi:subtilase family serine protease
MLRFITSRRALVSLFVLFFALATSFSLSATLVSSVSAASAYTALSRSYTTPPSGSKLKSRHASSAQLSISMLLQPRNETQLTNLMTTLYNPSSSQYHQWLTPAQFNAQFAPTSAQIAQAQSFLQSAGLKVGSSPTPFLVNAIGTTSQVETAFHTTISDYAAPKGQAFFQNDSAVQVPTSLNTVVSGVVGLSNIAHSHPYYITTRAAAKNLGKAVPNYGAGPGGSGLVPSQIASLYDSTNVYKLGNRGQGSGATLAVFELSGYTPSDITTYEHQFFGPTENVPLVDINVDGGPLTPKCPSGDQCTPNDYSGDIEVEADIEMQIAIAPKISRILVYNAPNDAQGITAIDEYFKIAQDNAADAISSSWGLCEPDAGFAQARSEFFAFAQMALQGQSVFSASGDTGAYDCLRGSGSTNLSVDDPSSQPFVTAVGGTSFETFDPGTNLHPTYPQGVESVWNVQDLCNGTSTGLAACSLLGAGGGGVSTFWGQPFYQHGPGVTSSLSQKSPYCQVALPGQYCREIPDVSANADEFTPYAEYCTGSASTNSTCATFSSTLHPPGWFGIGGTSLSSPLWSGIIALWDSVNGFRFGLANVGLYALFRTHDSYTRYYHDITGQNQAENNNGYFPTTPYYDVATGIGTPRISGIVLFNPRYGIY